MRFVTAANGRRQAPPQTATAERSREPQPQTAAAANRKCKPNCCTKPSLPQTAAVEVLGTKCSIPGASCQL